MRTLRKLLPVTRTSTDNALAAQMLAKWRADNGEATILTHRARPQADKVRIRRLWRLPQA